MPYFSLNLMIYLQAALVYCRLTGQRFMIDIKFEPVEFSDKPRTCLVNEMRNFNDEYVEPMRQNREYNDVIEAYKKKIEALDCENFKSMESPKNSEIESENKEGRVDMFDSRELIFDKEVMANIASQLNAIHAEFAGRPPPESVSSHCWRSKIPKCPEILKNYKSSEKDREDTVDTTDLRELIFNKEVMAKIAAQLNAIHAEFAGQFPPEPSCSTCRCCVENISEPSVFSEWSENRRIIEGKKFQERMANPLR